MVIHVLTYTMDLPLYDHEEESLLIELAILGQLAV